MADFNALEALINAYIKQNGVKAITGNILNGVLRGMVSALGKGWTIADGDATPTMDPGTMTGPVAYIAHTAGTYEHFGNLVVNDGEVALLKYNEQTWTKEVIASLAATASVDGNVGTPAVNVTFQNGVLTFDFRNIKGATGDAAGFGTINATVDANIGTPAVSVQTSGPDTAKNMTFAFTNLKGETGVTSVVATVDNTVGTPSCAVSLVGQELHLDFTGLKGPQGDTGSSVDYPFTIVNNLTTNDATQALSAAMGVQLEGEISQLEHKVTQYQPPAYKCFVATGADHSDEDDTTFAINDGVNPQYSESKNASLVFRSFLSLKLWGFDKTKKYVVSLFRYNFASTGDSQIRISELNGNSRSNEVIFYKSGVDVVGGVNSYNLTSSDGNHRMEVLLDYSLLPNHMSTGFAGYNKFIVAPECFVHYADEETVATMQTKVNNLDENALLDSDLTIERVSNNIANPEGIEDGKMIDVNGAIQSVAGWSMIGVPVTPGVKYTFGGFYLGRSAYYAFYDGGTMLSKAGFTDPNGTQTPVTATAPADANILYIDIASGNSPSEPYANLQINIGESLLDYDVYKTALTKIAGYSIEGTGGGGDLSTLIQDLPLSADGSDIATGYAYINSSTGAVIVKQ